jgi:hypothetical protein
MTTLDACSSLLMAISNGFGVICALIFIAIVIRHRHCHTSTILLAFNSVVAGLISNTVCGIQAIYQLTGDGKDQFCVLRGYLFLSATGLMYHTLCVQALYRFFLIVIPTRPYLQSNRVQVAMVVIQWLFSWSFVLPIVCDGRIRYNPGSRICLVSSHRHTRLINDDHGCSR